jgi:acyl-CoA thioesterase-1
MEPPSSATPSAIIIGDSVSIGYTPHLQTMLKGKVQVQHAPSAGGGGADDTPYGQQCIVSPLESFIRTARYTVAKYDVVTFNFGLHDMDYNSSDKSHSLANYTTQLEAIADRLVATKSKLLYV